MYVGADVYLHTILAASLERCTNLYVELHISELKSFEKNPLPQTNS